MNRYEKAAKRISEKYVVNVEWNPLNREYIVDTIACATARDAEKVARRITSSSWYTSTANYRL